WERSLVSSIACSRACSSASRSSSRNCGSNGPESWFSTPLLPEEDPRHATIVRRHRAGDPAALTWTAPPLASRTKVPRPGICGPAVLTRPGASLETAERTERPGWWARHMREAPEMRRRTFDAIATMTGVVLAVVLAIGGGLLLWGHSVVSTDVHNQLAAQKIAFPAAGSPQIKALPAADATAMRAYAGQTMTTGAQAQTY